MQWSYRWLGSPGSSADQRHSTVTSAAFSDDAVRRAARALHDQVCGRPDCLDSLSEFRLQSLTTAVLAGC